MPSNTTPGLKQFAVRLLAYETALGKSAGMKNSATFPVCEKLREPLGKFVGVGGFRSLLSRALALAGAEFPWLRKLEIKENGTLEGTDKLEGKLDPRALAEGEAALAAHLLGLLVTFIGPALTLRLLQDIWPKMGNLNF